MSVWICSENKKHVLGTILIPKTFYCEINSTKILVVLLCDYKCLYKFSHQLDHRKFQNINNNLQITSKWINNQINVLNLIPEIDTKVYASVLQCFRPELKLIVHILSWGRKWVSLCAKKVNMRALCLAACRPAMAPGLSSFTCTSPFFGSALALQCWGEEVRWSQECGCMPTSFAATAQGLPSRRRRGAAVVSKVRAKRRCLWTGGGGFGGQAGGICTFILLRGKQLVGPDAPSVARAGAGRQICSLHYMPGEGAKRQDLLMQLLNLVWKALCAQLGMVMGWVPVVFGPDGGGDGCKPQPPPPGVCGFFEDPKLGRCTIMR